MGPSQPTHTISIYLRLRVGLERGDAAHDGVELLVADDGAAGGGDGEQSREAGDQEHEDRGDLVRVRVRVGVRTRARVRVRVSVRWTRW